MGESAGGGLAAALALMARDRGGPKIAGQVLMYPMLDHRTGGPDDRVAALFGQPQPAFDTAADSTRNYDIAFAAPWSAGALDIRV